MNLVIPVALAVLLGASVCAVIWSLLGVELFPNTKRRVLELVRGIQNFSLWFFAALITALLVMFLTGWIVLSLWLFALVLAVPVLRDHGPNPEEEIRRVAAIATWAEQIRDTIAASAGIQQALSVTAQRPPAAIEPELRQFSYSVNRDLPQALRQLRTNLNHPSADLVIAGLLAAIELDAGKVSELLLRLSESIRSEAAMRQRVEVSRSRIRTSARIVGAANALTVLVLLIFGRGITRAYETTTGQLWLILVVGVVTLSLWSFRKLATIPQPARFVARDREAVPA